MNYALAIQTFREPAAVSQYSLQQWDLLIRQLRVSNLIGSFYELLLYLNLTDSIPEQVLWHFSATLTICHKHKSSVLWEVEELQNTLGIRGIPVILLKGAAYVAADLKAHRGRLFSDIDILVPKHVLSDVEAILKKHGWQMTHLNDYDQKVYREWSHELPPMKHFKRQTLLDIHHTIIPPTAKPKPDASKLLHDAVPISEFDEIYVLSPVDMVLHSAAHLFYDGELDHGLRDLVDLHNMLNEFSEKDNDFWTKLIDRAIQQELTTPLFYALKYVHLLLAHPIPEDTLKRSLQFRPGNIISTHFMDVMFIRALQPDHYSCSDRLTGFARWFLYIRSHYIKMPMYLLIPHLVYKATIAKYKENKEIEKQQKNKDFFANLKR